MSCFRRTLVVPSAWLMLSIGLAPVATATQPVPTGFSAGEWQAVQAQATSHLALTNAVAVSTTGGPLPAHGLVITDHVVGDYSNLPAQDEPEFGYSVAMDEGWLAVGEPGTIADSTTYGTRRHGQVTLFHYEDGQWQLKQRIRRGAYGDSRCGHSVALDVPHLIFGCPGGDATNNPSTEGGIVNWFVLDHGGTWVQTDWHFGSPGDRCGTSVAISGTVGASSPTSAFGCPGALNGADEVGAVAIFDLVTKGEWAFDTAVWASDGANGDSFGESISLYREATQPFGTELLAVGAPTKTFLPAFANGKVYMFNGFLTWTEVDSMTHFETSNHSLTLYGEDVAIRGDDLVIGSPGGYSSLCPNFPRCGLVHKFHYASGNWGYAGYATIGSSDNTGGNPPGPQAGMKFGQAVAIGFDGMVALSAPRTDGFTWNGGLAEEVGMVELRSLSNLSIQLGEVRPSLGILGLAGGHFGTDVDFGDAHLAVGYPDSGLLIVGGGGGRFGSVYIYGLDRIFANGFELE